MKKIFQLLFLTIGLFSFSSCGEDEYTDKEYAIPYSTENSTIPSTGGTVTFTVEGEGLTANADADWLTINVNGKTITATAPANPLRESRASHISVKAANGIIQLLSVVQSGLIAGPDTYNLRVSDNPDSYVVGMKADAKVTVKSLSDWISASINSSNDKIDVKVGSNNLREERIGKILFTCNDITDTLFITQDGMLFELETLTPTLYSNSATSRTIGVQHSKEVTVKSKSDWLTAAVVNNQIILNATANAEEVRIGYVEVTSGDVTETLAVGQFDWENGLKGNYYLHYASLSNGTNWQKMPVVLEDKSLYFNVRNGAGENYRMSIPIKMDNEAHTLEAGPCSSFIGNYVDVARGEMFIFFVFRSNPMYWSQYSADYSSYGDVSLEIKEDGSAGIRIDWSGTFAPAEYNIDAWALDAHRSIDRKASTRMGYVATYYFPYLEKVNSFE